MNSKSLLILLVLLVVGATAFYLSGDKSGINKAESIGSRIMPGLLEALNRVDRIQLTGAGSNIITTLVRKETQWTVAERENFSADISKIRSAVLSLAEARIIEEKTSNKQLYSKLGVEDLALNDASGIEVSVFYDGQKQSLIVGKPGPQINKNRYVRRSDSETSWLVDQRLDLMRDVAYWLQKDLISVEPNEISLIIIKHPDGARLEIENVGSAEDTFAVTNLTNPDSQVIDAEIHQVTNALSSFQLLDVISNTDFSGGEPTMSVTYQLKSGANIYLQAYEVDSDHFISMRAELREDTKSGTHDNEAKSFIEDIRTRFKDWVFKIPNVSYDSIYKREEDMLAITEDQLN